MLGATTGSLTAPSTTQATAASTSPPTTAKPTTSSPPTSHPASSPPASKSASSPGSPTAQAQPSTPRSSHHQTSASINPQGATPGQTLNVTISGSNFQTGATSSFGAGTNVTPNQLQLPHQPDRHRRGRRQRHAWRTRRHRQQPRRRQHHPHRRLHDRPRPPTLTLRYEGKLRDRVGEGNGLTSPDGKLDATFKVTVEPGSGPRTITQLELLDTQRQRPLGRIPTTQQWMLGATTGSLDGTPPQHKQRQRQLRHQRRPNPLPLRPRPLTQPLHRRRPSPPPRPASPTAQAQPSTPRSVAPPNSQLDQPTPGATPGQTLNVTISGSNFQTGATRQLWRRHQRHPKPASTPPPA